MKTREKIFVIGGLLLVLGTAAWKLTQGSATGSGDANSIPGAIGKIVEGERLHRSVDALVKELAVALPQTSPAEQESAIHDDLARKAQENQITVLSFKGMESAGRGNALKSVQMVQYRLELYGQFDAFMKLLNALEKSPIPYVVREIQFESAPRGLGGDKGGQGGGGQQAPPPEIPPPPPPPVAAPAPSKSGSISLPSGSSGSSTDVPETVLFNGQKIKVADIPAQYREKAIARWRKMQQGGGSSDSKSSKKGSASDEPDLHSSISSESGVQVIIEISESSLASASGRGEGRMSRRLSAAAADASAQQQGGGGGSPDGARGGVPANGKVHVTVRIQSYLFPAELPAAKNQVLTADMQKYFGNGQTNASAAERPAGRQK